MADGIQRRGRLDSGQRHAGMTVLDPRLRVAVDSVCSRQIRGLRNVAARLTARINQAYPNPPPSSAFSRQYQETIPLSQFSHGCVTGEQLQPEPQW